MCYPSKNTWAYAMCLVISFYKSRPEITCEVGWILMKSSQKRKILTSWITATLQLSPASHRCLISSCLRSYGSWPHFVLFIALEAIKILAKWLLQCIGLQCSEVLHSSLHTSQWHHLAAGQSELLVLPSSQYHSNIAKANYLVHSRGLTFQVCSTGVQLPACWESLIYKSGTRWTADMYNTPF